MKEEALLLNGNLKETKLNRHLQSALQVGGSGGTLFGRPWHRSPHLPALSGAAHRIRHPRGLRVRLHRLSLAVRVQAVVGVRGGDGLGEVGDGDVGGPLVHVRHGAPVELHVDEEVVDAGGEERRDEAHDPQRGLGLLGGCIRRSLNLLLILYEYSNKLPKTKPTALADFFLNLVLTFTSFQI